MKARVISFAICSAVLASAYYAGANSTLLSLGDPVIHGNSIKPALAPRLSFFAQVPDGTVPVLTSLSSSSAVSCSQASTVLTGTDFLFPPGPTGITTDLPVSALNIVSSTEIDVTFNLGGRGAAGFLRPTAPGVYPIQVTNNAGTSNALDFTVLPLAAGQRCLGR